MTVRIGEIVLDCSDPKRAAEFWCAALGYRITDRDETGVAIAGDSSAPTMLLLATSDVKHHKNRVHLDVCPVDGTNHADEVRRLEELGATRPRVRADRLVDGHGGPGRQRVLRDGDGPAG